jgi:hypothetical protein
MGGQEIFLSWADAHHKILQAGGVLYANGSQDIEYKSVPAGTYGRVTINQTGDLRYYFSTGEMKAIAAFFGLDDWRYAKATTAMILNYNNQYPDPSDPPPEPDPIPDDPSESQVLDTKQMAVIGGIAALLVIGGAFLLSR